LETGTRIYFPYIKTRIYYPVYKRKGAYKKDRKTLCIKAWSDSTRQNSFKLKESRFRLDIKI